MPNPLRFTVFLASLVLTVFVLVPDAFSSGPPRIAPDKCGWAYFYYDGWPNGKPRVEYRRMTHFLQGNPQFDEAACFARESYLLALRKKSKREIEDNSGCQTKAKKGQALSRFIKYRSEEQKKNEEVLSNFRVKFSPSIEGFKVLWLNMKPSKAGEEGEFWLVPDQRLIIHVVCRGVVHRNCRIVNRFTVN